MLFLHTKRCIDRSVGAYFLVHPVCWIDKIMNKNVLRKIKESKPHFIGNIVKQKLACWTCSKAL